MASLGNDTSLDEVVAANMHLVNVLGIGDAILLGKSRGHPYLRLDADMSCV